MFPSTLVLWKVSTDFFSLMLKLIYEVPAIYEVTDFQKQNSSVLSQLSAPLQMLFLSGPIFYTRCPFLLPSFTTLKTSGYF